MPSLGAVGTKFVADVADVAIITNITNITDVTIVIAKRLSLVQDENVGAQ